MARFVSATHYNNGRKVFANPDNILFFYVRADSRTTVVVFRDNMTLEIEEKPDELAQVIQDAYT